MAIHDNPLCFKRLLLGITLLVSSIAAGADWKAQVNNRVYFTDDVALFSATRQLSLKDDPTQPLVDRPNQGSDFVYEPSVELDWSGNNFLGEAELAFDAGGYVFKDQTAFTHGLYEVQASQAFATDTTVRLHYNYVPDLYVGENAFTHHDGEEADYAEELTSHYWSLHVDQALTEHIILRLLGRYGLREYNEPFLHRNTQFWTIGPHIEWIISPDIDLLIGYHYEQGRADHHKALYYDDDISYVNHYASAELKIRLVERLSALFIVDYEQNDFSTPDRLDEHFGQYEALYQGEFELLYEVDKSTTITAGWQHGNRSITMDAETISNNNVWLGVEYTF